MSIDIYSEIILDHSKNPRNFGKIEKADAKAFDLNPACGDKIEIFLKIKDNKLSNVKFEGSGCAISQAAASMLTEDVKGKDLEYIRSLPDDFTVQLLGVKLSPLRLKCALLSMNVLKAAARFS